MFSAIIYPGARHSLSCLTQLPSSDFAHVPDPKPTSSPSQLSIRRPVSLRFRSVLSSQSFPARWRSMLRLMSNRLDDSRYSPVQLTARPLHFLPTCSADATEYCQAYTHRPSTSEPIITSPSHRIGSRLQAPVPSCPLLPGACEAANGG